MSEFDPSQPAILHDSLNEKMVPWSGEKAASWRDHASPYAEGVISNGMASLFDGWKRR
jgi:hypothetical protein